VRVADPPNRSGTLESYGYKQLLVEPVVGGGLFTGSSVALIAASGLRPILRLTRTFTGVVPGVGPRHGIVGKKLLPPPRP
jgi:glutamate:Na+ symporter, ESS family